MAAKVTILKALEDRLRKMCSTDGFKSQEEHGTYSATTARQLVSLIEDAKVRKEKAKSLSPQEAIRIIRGVLGPAAALPPSPTRAFYSWMGRRIQFLGLTAEDCEKAAIRAKHTYRLPTSVEWIIRTADNLLTDAPEEENQELKVTTGRGDDS